MRIPVSVAACAAVFVAFSPIAAGEARAPCKSSLSFVSEPGDPIGRGKSRTYKAVRSARITENTVRVIVNEDSETAPYYELELQAAEGQKLRPGVYVVDGTPSASEPRMHFGGNGRWCDRVEGRFEIESIRFAAYGYVEHLKANFEQRCNGKSATLWGDVMVNNPDKPPAMRAKLRIERDAPIVNGETRPVLVYACEYPTGGTVRATLRQRQADGSVETESFEERGFSCGPKAQRQYIPFSAFDPGKAELSAEIEMIDPNYYEDDGDPVVVRSAKRIVRIY
jgi:hypothetical protein